ncbi:30016_t:CDS:1, partial [Racocetra persica]
IKDICFINLSKPELSEQKNNQVSFLPMEDLGESSLYTVPSKIRKIEEVYKKGYTYFQENDLLLAKLGVCFENNKMSIAKNLVNGVGFGSTEFIVLRAKEGILIE